MSKEENLISSRKFTLLLGGLCLILTIAVLSFAIFQFKTSFAANNLSIDYQTLKNEKPTDKIQVFFNRPADHSYQNGNSRQANEEIDFRTIIVEKIENARQTIDFAVMYLEDPKIINAIKAAHQRGVQIRIIVDFEKYEETLSAFSGTDITIRENNGGIVEDGYKVEKSIMHYKFALFDSESKENSYLITSSANWNQKDFDLNANNLVLIQDQALSNAYLDEFDQMWAGKFNRDKDLSKHKGEIFEIDGRIVELWLSPAPDPFSSFQMRLINLFREAKDSIYFATFNFTLPQISQELEKKYAGGIDFEGISNESIWDMKGSVLFDMRGVTHSKLFTPWKQIPFENIRHDAIDGNSALHYKYFIIDENIAVTGASNPTLSAVYTNDEDLLIIHDPLIANEFKQNFFYHFKRYGGITKDSIVKIENFDDKGSTLILRNLTDSPINLKDWLIISTDTVLRNNEYFPKNEFRINEDLLVPANDKLTIKLPAEFLAKNNESDKFPLSNSQDNGEIYLFDSFDLLHHMVWY